MEMLFSAPEKDGNVESRYHNERDCRWAETADPRSADIQDEELMSTLTRAMGSETPAFSLQRCRRI